MNLVVSRDYCALLVDGPELPVACARPPIARAFPIQAPQNGAAGREHHTANVNRCAATKGLRGDYRTAAKANSSAYCRFAESERTNRSGPPCAADGRQQSVRAERAYFTPENWPANVTRY